MNACRRAASHPRIHKLLQNGPAPLIERIDDSLLVQRKWIRRRASRFVPVRWTRQGAVRYRAERHVGDRNLRAGMTGPFEGPIYLAHIRAGIAETFQRNAHLQPLRFRQRGKLWSHCHLTTAAGSAADPDCRGVPR